MNAARQAARCVGWKAQEGRLGFSGGPVWLEGGLRAVQTPVKAPHVCLWFVKESTSEPHRGPIQDCLDGLYGLDIMIQTDAGHLRVDFGDALTRIAKSVRLHGGLPCENCRGRAECRSSLGGSGGGDLVALALVHTIVPKAICRELVVQGRRGMRHVGGSLVPHSYRVLSSSRCARVCCKIFPSWIAIKMWLPLCHIKD